jgi:hypothetical protein
MYENGKASNFQKSIVMFMRVSDMLTGLGKYRSEGRHGGRYVAVVLHNNF